MRIHIKSEGKNLHFWIPTNFVFSRGIAWLAVRFGLHYANMDLSPEQLYRLFAEFRRIKRKYRTWELVNVESADGEQVKVVL